MKTSKSLFGLVAFSAVLTMPMAFAQETNVATQQDSVSQAVSLAEQAAPPAGGEASSTTTDDTAPAAGGVSAEPKKVTWSDLDADKDGNLSKNEAQLLSSLSDVFDQADSDADGSLTADEYKAFLAKNGNGATPPES